MWLHDLGLVLEAGEHDGFKRFHNRSNFHTGNQKYFNLKAKLFWDNFTYYRDLKMGNLLIKHPSSVQINGKFRFSILENTLYNKLYFLILCHRTKVRSVVISCVCFANFAPANIQIFTIFQFT